MINLLLEKPGTEFAPYKNALLNIGRKNPRVVVLGADLANSTEIDSFREEFPDRFFNLGAAEQNEVNVAAGLALEGEIPFVHSFGVFVTRRTYEQVCVQVAMQKANVKIIGAIPGLLSRLGPTHQAIDDLALMRLLPGMVVIDPADATEISQVVPHIAEYDGPVYMRTMRREVASIFNPKTYRFKIGKAVRLFDGDDISLITTGLMLEAAVSARRILKDDGIEASLLHVSTVKPIDREAIIALAEKTRRVITVENHLISGGLGTAVSEVLSEFCPVPLCRMGLNDSFAEPGTPEYLFEKYGLTDKCIVKAAKRFLGKR